MPAPVRVVLGAALTLVIAVLAVLPPILHFITGPVAPAIGGFIAGRQLRLSDREAAFMGVILAVSAGVPAFIVMDRLVANDTFAVVLAIVGAIWTGGLATIAAWFAGGGEEQLPDEAIAGE